MRDGKPVAGFAFNSTGRYACGAQMRDRFIPRILKAAIRNRCSTKPATISIRKKSSPCMMRNEKSGGHSERSVGIGTIEVAVWDAVAKIEDKPLHRVLAERYSGGKLADKVFCYVGGGWYSAGRDPQDRAGRDAPPSRRRLHHAEDEGRRPAARRRHEARRGGEVDPARRHAARGRRQLQVRRATRRWPTPRRWRRSSCAGSRSRAIRSTSRCWRRSPRSMTARCRPARTCSRPRTWRTWCGSAG